MPGSLLNTLPSTGGNHNIVHRSDSNRSDRSEASAYSSEGGSSKKVSFNKAVRVKKYTTPPISPIDIPENKFWFKVYKTQQYKPDSSNSVATQFDEPEEEYNNNNQNNEQTTNNVRPLSTIVESGDSSSSIPTPEMSRRVHSSRYDSLSPTGSKQRVTRNRSNSSDRDVEVIKPTDTYYKYRDYSVRDRDVSPSLSSVSARNSGLRSQRPQEPEIDYVKVKSRSTLPSKLSKSTTINQNESEKPSKRNPIVNGVKVIFGISPSIPKKGKTQAKLEQTEPVRESHSNDSPVQNKQRFESTDRSKNNKLDIYTTPSRNANLTNRKLQNSNNSDTALKTKNTNNKRFENSPSNSNHNNRRKDDTYSDMGNETLALDEVINNARLDLVSRTDSDDERHRHIDTVQVIPVEVWRSGPRLMAEKTDFQKSLTELPGEGKTFSTKEEGTKVWQNKTRRRYHEIVPKHNKEYRRTDVKSIEDIDDSPTTHKMISPATDDEKSVTLNDLDEMFLEKKPKESANDYPSEYSYIPTVRDVGIQCNRKKTNRHLLKNTMNDSSYRIIKSSNNGLVSAYSDVPQLRPESPSHRTPISKHEVWESSLPQNEAIYSQIDKSKKKAFKGDIIRHNYDEMDVNYPEVIYRTPLNERRSPASPTGIRPQSGSRYPGSEYSTNTNRTIKNKTKGFGFTLSSGVDGPDVDLPKSSPKLRSRSIKQYEEPVNDWNDGLRDGYKREVKQEVLEETISISNASSEDLMQNYQNTDIDEFLAPKSIIKELDHKRKEISYVNVSPNQRHRSGDAYEGATTNGGGLWLRDIDEDYRRGMAQNEVSHPGANEPSFATLSRLESKNRNAQPRDFSPPPRQAFTLDRRHLKERQKRLESLSDSKNTNKENTFERKYRSNADLTEQLRNDETRGGLAAAYKNRQDKRASSLNRMSAIREGRVSPTHSTPRSYLSHSHLNSAGNSAQSSSDSDTLNRHKRQYVHDREPIVMYIPAVSHHTKKAEDEPDRLSGILRRNSITSKTSAKYRKAPKSSASSDITPTKPREYPGSYSKYGNHRPGNEEEMDEIVELRDTKQFGKSKKGKKTGLSRRHSIPKDTKFPWLQKLKFKVKSKDM